MSDTLDRLLFQIDPRSVYLVTLDRTFSIIRVQHLLQSQIILRLLGLPRPLVHHPKENWWRHPAEIDGLWSRNNGSICSTFCLAEMGQLFCSWWNLSICMYLRIRYLVWFHDFWTHRSDSHVFGRVAFYASIFDRGFWHLHLPWTWWCWSPIFGPLHISCLTCIFVL